MKNGSLRQQVVGVDGRDSQHHYEGSMMGNYFSEMIEMAEL